jgi:thiamine-phosphate pyrophosphorylase
MLLNAITDRTLFPGDEAARRSALLAQVNQWARDARVGLIQVREKDLPEDELADLAARIVAASTRHRSAGHAGTKVLVNGPIHVARNAGAQGVHFPSRTGGTSLAQWLRETRAAWDGHLPYVSVACHSLEQVREAAGLEVAQIVFSPVFEKPLRGTGDPPALPGVGLESLRKACQAGAPVPVVALGGVTAQNAKACVDAGAAGVAGIRLFMANDWQQLATPRSLRC